MPSVPAWIAWPGVLLVLGSPAFAQESLEGRIGAGPGFAPEYLGSDEYRPIPVVPLSLRYKGYGVRTAGQGLQVDVVGWRLLNFGPLVQYRAGRDDDIDDPVVRLLPEIDPTVEAGAFVEVNLPFFAPGRDAVTLIGRVAFDVAGSHDGFVVEPALRYSVPVNESLRLTLTGSAIYGSGDFQDTYFSVRPAGAAASGLPVFDADAGFTQAGATLSGNYVVTEHWGFTVIGRYRRLLGDAADSPVVDDRGSADQFLGGIALTYTF